MTSGNNEIQRNTEKCNFFSERWRHVWQTRQPLEFIRGMCRNKEIPLNAKSCSKQIAKLTTFCQYDNKGQRLLNCYTHFMEQIIPCTYMCRKLFVPENVCSSLAAVLIWQRYLSKRYKIKHKHTWLAVWALLFIVSLDCHKTTLSAIWR